MNPTLFLTLGGRLLGGCPASAGWVGQAAQRRCARGPRLPTRQALPLLDTAACCEAAAADLGLGAPLEAVYSGAGGESLRPRSPERRFAPIITFRRRNTRAGDVSRVEGGVGRREGRRPAQAHHPLPSPTWDKVCARRAEGWGGGGVKKGSRWVSYGPSRVRVGRTVYPGRPPRGTIAPLRRTPLATATGRQQDASRTPAAGPTTFAAASSRAGLLRRDRATAAASGARQLLAAHSARDALIKAAIRAQPSGALVVGAVGTAGDRPQELLIKVRGRRGRGRRRAGQSDARH